MRNSCEALLNFLETGLTFESMLFWLDLKWMKVRLLQHMVENQHDVMCFFVFSGDFCFGNEVLYNAMELLMVQKSGDRHLGCIRPLI